MTPSKEERITCNHCGRVIAGYVPRGGDGTALRPRRHNRPGGGTCVGIYSLVYPTTPPRVLDLMADCVVDEKARPLVVMWCPWEHTTLWPSDLLPLPKHCPAKTAEDVDGARHYCNRPLTEKATVLRGRKPDA